MGKQTFDKQRFQEAEVRALREKGMKVNEIAAHYGCALSTMAAVLREYGLSQERHRVHVEEREAAEVELKPQSELLERYEQRMRQNAEIVKKREERLLEWRQRRKSKENRTKTISVEEVPRGYIW